MEDIEEIQERAIKQQKGSQKKQKEAKNKIRREERKKFDAVKDDRSAINLKGLKPMPAGAKDYTPGQTMDPTKGLLDDKGNPLVSPNDVEIEMGSLENSSKKLLKGIDDSFE